MSICQNPTVRVTEELESCIGCMAQTANVRIQRACQSSQEGAAGGGQGEGALVGQGEGAGEDPCVNCYCRPMWCIDCMAKW